MENVTCGQVKFRQHFNNNADSFGVVNLLSLYKELDDKQFLDQAEQVVNDVFTVLGKTYKIQNYTKIQKGRPVGFRIGEHPNKDGQYFHYLMKWMFAMNELAKIKPESQQ